MYTPAALQSTYTRSRLLTSTALDFPRSRSVERGSRGGGGGGSVISASGKVSIPGATPFEKLRRADDMLAEQKRSIAERDLTIRKQQEDLKYRSRRMMEMERTIKDQADEIATLRQELDRARSARVYKGQRAV